MRGFESPLLALEQRVLQRAKELALDLADDDALHRLRELLAEEVDRWNLDVEQGVRTVALPDRDAVVERAVRDLAGYGPLEALLADDDVWEIMINAPDQIFVKRHLGVSGYHDEQFHDDEHVTRTLTKILDDAAGAHRKLDPAEGLQDAQLDDGSRLHIVHRDIGRGGHLLVNIRRFTGVTFASLDELVERDMMSDEVARFLRAATRARLSIVFAGPPGSGKTTLLSCCMAELDPALRVVTAEEVFEVDVPLPNVASMQTRGARPERGEVDLRRLVAGFLRMAPDVAVVGEVRDRDRLPELAAHGAGAAFTTAPVGARIRPSNLRTEVPLRAPPPRQQPRSGGSATPSTAEPARARQPKSGQIPTLPTPHRRPDPAHRDHPRSPPRHTARESPLRTGRDASATRPSRP